MRSKTRIHALFSSTLILVILSIAGCGRGNSPKQFLIWRLIGMPDEVPKKNFEGVADSWAVEVLREDIACFGADCAGRDIITITDSGIRRRLMAEQFPHREQESGIEARLREKPLFPAYLHSALATLLGRSSVYHEKVQYDKAVSEFTDAIEMNPGDAAAYCNRGAAHAKTGRYDWAISDYSKALEINPQFAKAFYNRGVAYYRKGQHNLAISDYARAIEIDPQLRKQDDLFVRVIRKKWANLKEG